MPGQIFISYRRNDAAYVTGHINDRLCKEFGPESIFTDVDNIALGVDFRSVLDEKVGQCQILLAVIGDHWLEAKNQEGKLRLHDPADFVRIEIESALQRGIPVIPLLVAGTTMPSKDALPESLQDLSFRNGTQIRPVPDFHADIDRLIHSLKKHLHTESTKPKDAGVEHSAAESGQRPEQRQEPYLDDGNRSRRHEDSQPESSDTNVIPEHDERARKQIELTRQQTQKKRSAFSYWPLVVALILVVAGASWYIDFDYEKQFNALTTMRGPAAEDEAKLTADTTVQAQSEADAFATVQPVATDTIAEAESETEFVDEAQGEAKLVAKDQVAEGESDTTTQAQAESDVITEAQVEADLTADTEAQTQLGASAAFSEGNSLAALGNHQAAIEHYDEAIRLIAEPAFVYKQRGASYQALGDHEAAVKDYSEAIRLNPEDANAFHDRGTAYQELGDHAAAIENYDEVIRLNPEFAGAFHSRGTSHEALGNLEAAESDFAVAAELRSSRNDAN